MITQVEQILQAQKLVGKVAVKYHCLLEISSSSFLGSKKTILNFSAILSCHSILIACSEISKGLFAKNMGGITKQLSTYI